LCFRPTPNTPERADRKRIGRDQVRLTSASERTDSSMKAVILAGGYGSRLSEETTVRPKPMVEIGSYPILWHIMKIYSHYGIRDFIICCGYKGHMIKQYFAEFVWHACDLRVDLAHQRVETLNAPPEPWTVTLIDTGLNTGTAGRLKMIQQYVGNEAFCFTYGDGVTDADISEIIQFHKQTGALATLTAIHPPARYGTFELTDGNHNINWFKEKLQKDNAWVNGGFFVLEPEIFNYIEGPEQMWEAQPMERLAKEGKLAAYRHTGFWKCMDHLSDKIQLEKLWESGNPPWKVWS
jgi:glucose-1-phosphate cytidylyltransferase